MRNLRSTWGKRGIIASLLLSMLPLLVHPVIRDGSDTSIDRYADWLRRQFEKAPVEIVDQAIEAAKRVDSSDISVFLQAFIEAYNTFSGAGTISVSDHAFFGAFQFQFLQFAGNALVPHWLFKSAQARTTLSQERTVSGLKAAIRIAFVAPLLGGGRAITAGNLLPVLSIPRAINPRAP